MDLTRRQRRELGAIIALSAVLAVTAVGMGRFDLVSGPRAFGKYDKTYSQLLVKESAEERIEGNWDATAKGLRLQPGRSGTLTVKIPREREGGLAVLLSGQTGPGLQAVVLVSADGRTFRVAVRSISLDGRRIDLTPAVNPSGEVWIRIRATLEANAEGEPLILSRMRVVALQPPLRLPNVPIALLLILTPVLAYVTRAAIRPTGAAAYSLAVLFGLAILVEGLHASFTAVESPRWWELVIASQARAIYFLPPYVTLLILLGWQTRIASNSSAQTQLWSCFALGGILAWGGSCRLGALIELAPVEPSGDALHYMLLAQAMRSPYDTGFREPFWTWMIKMWFWLVGESGLHLRLLTVGLSLLVLLAGYKLFRDYTDRPLVGILVAGLLAVNPYLIRLSVQGLREEAYMLAVLCVVYGVVVADRRWSVKGQAIGLACSGAAVQLLRFSSYVFLIPLLLIWAWRQGPGKWKIVILPLAMIVAVSVPHLVHNAREFGDPMYSVNIHFLYARNYEFMIVKQTGCQGCPTRFEDCCTGPALSAKEYLFGMHTPEELLERTVRGYLDLYLRPTELFEIQSGTRSPMGFTFYLLGLGLVLLGSYRGVLVVILLLANVVPFALSLGIDPRLGVQTIPFVTFILAYGLWWSFDRVVHFRTWIGAPVMAWRRPRILSRLGAELMDQRFRLR